MIYYILHILLFFCCLSVLAKEPITLSLRSNEEFAELDIWLKDIIAVDDILIDADIAIEQREIFYLLNISSGKPFNIQDVKQSCINLKKKNRFSTIRLSLQEEFNKKQLHIFLEGSWLYKKIVIDGSILGKDQYRQYYGCDVGDFFDIQKHEYYVHIIQKVLFDEGYLSAQVKDSLEYYREDKTIIAIIYIEPGAQHLIKHVHFDFSANAPGMIEILKNLEDKLHRKIISSMVDEYCSKKLIKKKIKELHDYLVIKGFVKIDCAYELSQKNIPGETDITFNIQSADRKYFVFAGNRFFSSKQLMQHLLGYADILHSLPTSFLEEELVQLYGKKGFCNVSIEFQSKDNHLQCLIQEGERATFGHIHVQGNTYLDQQAIIKHFLPHSKKAWDEDELKSCLTQLTHFYMQKGFWDMNVNKFWCECQHGISHTFISMEEGKQRILVNVKVDGYEHKDLQYFLEEYRKKLPMPFALDLLHEQRQFIMRLLQSQGYIYASIKPIFEETNDGTQIIWDIELKTAPVLFGKTIMQGSSVLPFEAIMARLAFKEGQVWKKDVLDKAATRLRESQVFETIYISPEAQSQVNMQRNVLLKVVDDDPFEIRLRAGIQQVSRNLRFRNGTTYKFGSTIFYKNPLHHADFLKLDADITRFFRYTSAAYCYPWMFNMPLNFVIKGYNNKYIQPLVIGSDKTLYKVTQEGGLCGLNYLFDGCYMGLNIGVELMETSALSTEVAHAINFAPRLINQLIPYIFFEPSFFLERLDNKVDPTTGTLTAISCKGMYSWHHKGVNFFKCLLEQSVFIPIPIYYKTVFAFRVRIGHIFNQSLQSIMPPERFLLGGAYSMRGYLPDLAPPLGIIYEDGKEKLVPQGGRSMFNLNVELRFPLYKHLGGVIFQDTGALLEKSIAEVKGSRLITASGFGLRYLTPIGPLRFDFGVKWRVLNKLESRYAWFLTLGHAF